MYYPSKNCFDMFKTSFLIFTFLFTVFLILSVFFTNEAFAMEPNTVIDYYGDKEYIGPDPYGHNNDPAKISAIPAILANPDIIQSSQNDSYATSAPYEEDWYAKNEPQIMQPSVDKNNYIYTLFTSLKRRTFWYVWKIHSDDYSNYKDFKGSWDSRNSIRKEILKNIRSGFKNLSTKK